MNYAMNSDDKLEVIRHPKKNWRTDGVRSIKYDSLIDFIIFVSNYCHSHRWVKKNWNSHHWLHDWRLLLQHTDSAATWRNPSKILFGFHDNKQLNCVCNDTCIIFNSDCKRKVLYIGRGENEREGEFNSATHTRYLISRNGRARFAATATTLQRTRWDNNWG